MSGFADSFPDSEILELLGDDIIHIKPGGGSESFKGEFERKYLDEELGGQLDVIYPMIELNDSDAMGVKTRSKIKVGSTVFGVLRKYPVSPGKTRIILKS